MNFSRLKIPTITLAAVALVVGVSSTAVAAKLITSADIKDGTIVSKDLKKGAIGGDRLKNGSINTGRLKDGAVTSSKIKDGAVGPNDLSQAAKDSLKPSYGQTNWSVVDRNVIGNGDAFLRAGPSVMTATGPDGPPLGIGSLGIRTGASSDKAAFGNQVDFFGMPFSDVTAVGYSVFATGEDVTPPGALTNLPGISFEVNFNPGGLLDFHTVTYQPSINLTDVNRWATKDAVADTGAHWGIGGIGMDTLCDQNGTLCTFADVQAYLAANAPNAEILTVQITKGRDFAFSGAVDALRLNNDVFDFEPFGVVQTTAAAAQRR